MRTRTLVLSTEIERETGFRKDQLRKWRQRFGFPKVESTVNGKSAYSSQTVDQLLLIKRLLEAGLRPGHVVGKSAPELEKLKLALDLSATPTCHDESSQAFIDQLVHTDLAGFSALLVEERAKRTMIDFVSNTIGPLMIDVGEAWKRNELDIHSEHLCSSCIERYLHSEILKFKPKTGMPNILFALAPGERHLLGLLMVEAVLAEEGARTTCIGSDIPLNNLQLAAIACQADVVALSFSFAYPERNVFATLLHLRRLLPLHIQVWAGGAGLSGIRKRPKGVRIFTDLQDAVTALKDFSPELQAQNNPGH
jgi:methanogenic corrinoid protein MtbC1